jgi:hypothetical protein
MYRTYRIKKIEYLVNPVDPVRLFLCPCFPRESVAEL